MLSQKDLQSSLPVHGLGEPLYYYPSVGSTNDRAAELAEGGAPHGTLVVAEEQTRGRGRAGRSWFSPQGSALAFSLLLGPDGFNPAYSNVLGVLGALSVVEAVETRGGQALIKWPNDVLLDGLKVAGVLAEAGWVGGRLSHAILGIGVNVLQASAPDDRLLDFPATSLEISLGKKVDRQRLLLDILEGVGKWLPGLGSDELRRAWRDRLAFLGERVSVSNPDVAVVGTYSGIDSDGRIVLLDRDGEELRLSAGDLHLRVVDRN